MIIVNYTGKNYKDCLDITLPTWKADRVIVYSDNDDFGFKLFEPSTDFNESCRRKILSIKHAISNHMGEDILYLDTDVFMTKTVYEVFDNPADLIVTRMVRRKKHTRPEINAGVIFLRANTRTLAMCDYWLEKEAEYAKRQIVKFPEQHALDTVATQGYDGLIDLEVSNVSEEIYNYDRDNQIAFISEMRNPSLIHLKTKKWKDTAIVNIMRTKFKVI